MEMRAREAKVTTMWMCCGIEDAAKIFQGAIDDDFVLFSDPMMASEVGSFKNGIRGVLSGAADAEGEVDFETMGENGVSNTMAGIVSKPLRKVVGEKVGEVEGVREGAEVPFAAFYMVQCRVAVSLFSAINVEERPTDKDLKGLKAQIPKSAQALKVTWGGGGQEVEVEEGQTSRKAPFMYLIKKNRSAHVLPEYHLLVAGNTLKDEVLRVENMLERMKVPETEGSAEEGEEIPKSLEAKIGEECRRYQEALWEEVDPATAEKLRQADADIRHREAMVSKARESIENERETQEQMLREFRAGLGGGGGR